MRLFRMSHDRQGWSTHRGDIGGCLGSRHWRGAPGCHLPLTPLPAISSVSEMVGSRYREEVLLHTGHFHLTRKLSSKEHLPATAQGPGSARKRVDFNAGWLSLVRKLPSKKCLPLLLPRPRSLFHVPS